MRTLIKYFLCLAALAPLAAQPISRPVDVTICGVTATVQYEGEWGFQDAYVVNSKDEWISDKYTGDPGRFHDDEQAWRPDHRRALVPGGRIRTFKPEDLKALFDDNPKTAFRLPAFTDTYGFQEHAILITFKEPQVIDALLIRPGWQKSSKTFAHFEMPTAVGVYIERQRAIEGDILMDGQRAYPPRNMIERGVNRSPIIRPVATSKNMSERLLVFNEPRTVTQMRIMFGMNDSPEYISRHFSYEESRLRAYISDLLPVVVGHSTGNKLRDGLVEVLRKVRDKRCQDLVIQSKLPDISGEVSPHLLPVGIGEPLYDSFFRVFKQSYLIDGERGGTSRLCYRNNQLWAYGYSSEAGYPVLIVDEQGHLVDAWERSEIDGAYLP